MDKLIEINRNVAEPLYLQIGNHLRRKITSGELAPGTKLPNGMELAQQYNVAYATMIQSLNLLKREGLTQAVPKRGTYVKARKAIYNIAITFDSKYYKCKDIGFEQHLRAITQGFDSEEFYVHAYGLPGLKIFGNTPPTLLSKLIETKELSGIITTGAHPVSDAEELIRCGFPTVFSRDISPFPEIPYTIENVADGAKQIVDLLVHKLKHRRIGLLMGPRRGHGVQLTRPTTLLSEALASELQKQALPVSDDTVIYGDMFWQTYCSKVRQWLKLSNRPTALVLCSDSMAPECIGMIREMGLRIPEDISIIAYIDSLPNSILTTVSVPVSQMAKTAVEYLKLLLEGKKVVTEVSPVQLVVRNTCGICPEKIKITSI